MDRKKLIGTIIGVIFFVALIAGATFAWLTFNANVTNGNYNVRTGNFLVDYQGDTELTDIKTLSNVTAANVATSGATKVTVKAAKKTADSANGTLTVKLTTTSTGDTALDLSSGVLKYCLCSTSSSCNFINNSPRFNYYRFNINYTNKRNGVFLVRF